MNQNIWWRKSDSYTQDEVVPYAFRSLCGPKGVAVVRAWDDGKTMKGWGTTAKKPGDPTFMEQYNADVFNVAKHERGYKLGTWNLAYIMRSLAIVCVDIDGKNGGIENAIRLGPLPVTLAETSKSGDGYHLFYSVLEETWDEALGYAKYSDRIGIETGVDIRATGCVYHYPSQRWNTADIAPLPEQLARRLMNSSQQIAARAELITKTLTTAEDHEVLMMKQALIDDLAKPIPAGRRNNTLFALGSQMKLAQVEGWDDMVRARAIEVGLDSDEADKLVGNISNYA